MEKKVKRKCGISATEADVTEGERTEILYHRTGGLGAGRIRWRG